MHKPASWAAGLVLAATACGTGGSPADDGAAPSAPSVPTTPTTGPTPTTTSTPSTTVTATTTTSTTTTSTTTTSTTATTTTTTTTTTTSPTTTTVPVPAVQSIATAGDSLMLGVLPALQTALVHSGYDVDAFWYLGVLDPKGDERWDEAVAAAPDVLVTMFAPWEIASLETALVLDGSDPAWTGRYRTEFVDPQVEALAATGIELIWIAPPAVADADRTARAREIAATWRAALEPYPTMTWLDGSLAADDGGYRELDTTVSPPERLFMADGEHLCPGGGRRVAERVLAVLTERYGIVVDETWADTGWEDNAAAYGEGNC